MATTFTEVGCFVVVTCCECGVSFGMPARLHRDRKEHGGDFYCPNGHCQAYREPTVKKLEEALAEAHRQKQSIADDLERARDDAKRIEQSRRAYKAKATILRRRVAEGKCPCCKETFDDLKKHIARTHPGYADVAP